MPEQASDLHSLAGLRQATGTGATGIEYLGANLDAIYHAEALEARQPIRTLHAGGGFSKNRLWVQMLADIFQKSVLLNENDADASVLGAAKFAREVLNLGQLPDRQRGRVVKPDVGNAEIYEKAFRQFKLLAAQ